MIFYLSHTIARFWLPMPAARCNLMAIVTCHYNLAHTITIVRVYTYVGLYLGLGSWGKVRGRQLKLGADMKQKVDKIINLIYSFYHPSLPIRLHPEPTAFASDHMMLYWLLLHTAIPSLGPLCSGSEKAEPSIFLH